MAEKPVRVIESFLASKAGTPDGGADRLVLGPRYFGVVDGATARGVEWNARPSGEVLAEVVASELACDDATADPQQLVQLINKAIHQAAREASIDLTNPAQRSDVGFAAYASEARAIYHIHDCAFAFVLDDGTFVLHSHEKPIDRFHSELRTHAVQFLRAQGIDPFAAAGDLGREFIRPFLERLPDLQNRDPADTTAWALGLPHGLFAYRTLNGYSTELSVTPVPPRTREIVLASDGFPELTANLTETRGLLERQLAADPHCVEQLRSTKGRVGTNPYHDDLSYLRVQVS